MPSHAETLRKQIAENAVEINRLHSRIHETFRRREDSDQALREWKEACQELHSRYGQLCLPGGWDQRFFERVVAGDDAAVELALCFLEVRPYFIRSGYLWKDILRKCKRAPMTGEHAERFKLLLMNYNEWKQRQRLSAERGSAVIHKLWPLVRRTYDRFPVSLPAAKFDGVRTVGDFYNMLCRALKVEPLADPDKHKGTARERRPIPRGDREAWARDFRQWTEFAWKAEDVWATLVSLIAETYGADSSSAVLPSTPFGISEDK